MCYNISITIYKMKQDKSYLQKEWVLKIYLIII